MVCVHIHHLVCVRVTMHRLFGSTAGGVVECPESGGDPFHEPTVAVVPDLKGGGHGPVVWPRVGSGGVSVMGDLVVLLVFVVADRSV